MSKVFPKWSNALPLQIVIFAAIAASTVVLGITYYATPKYTRVGYEPTQPVPYDHKFHVGELGLDCRYCHNNVDKSGHANVPSSSTCMNCHSLIKTESELLEPIRASYESGEAVPWVRIHQTPDYVFFDHSVHVNRGISCVECHGRVDEMEVVKHAESHSMAFCLDCHRNPEEALRPLDKVYDLGWEHPGGINGQIKMGEELKEKWNVNPPQSCSGCHR
ncbi:MAG: cytochrome c3 family protein [Symploca sp. SIO2D2]|nr:cytochrome c3 family protein [Symploca sp. SIO2D2]